MFLKPPKLAELFPKYLFHFYQRMSERKKYREACKHAYTTFANYTAHQRNEKQTYCLGELSLMFNEY